MITTLPGGYQLVAKKVPDVDGLSLKAITEIPVGTKIPFKGRFFDTEREALAHAPSVVKVGRRRWFAPARKGAYLAAHGIGDSGANARLIASNVNPYLKVTKHIHKNEFVVYFYGKRFHNKLKRAGFAPAEAQPTLPKRGRGRPPGKRRNRT